MTKNALSRADWAKRINASMAKGCEAFIRVGKDLIAAKDQLPHGEFTKMVENDLPFGVRTAQVFMRIASDGRLAKANHDSCLPSDWNILNALTGLDDKTFNEAVESGKICPTTTREDVKRLKERNFEPPPVDDAPKPFSGLPDGPYKELVATFCERRHFIQASQVDLDRMVGWADGYAAKVEIGIRIPSLATAIDWAEALGCRIMLIPDHSIRVRKPDQAA